jgi:hypothetical protein
LVELVEFDEELVELGEEAVVADILLFENEK